MGLMDKFKNFMGIPEDERDDYEEEEVDLDARSQYDYDEEADKPAEKPANVWKEPTPVRREQRDAPAADRVARENKVVTIPATTQLQVVIVKPERFDEGSAIGDHLNAKRTVVLNLESTNKDTARRLVDFLSGVAYANGGQIKKVANSTFIITPYNVPVVGDTILDELENNGVYFNND